MIFFSSFCYKFPSFRKLWHISARSLDERLYAINLSAVSFIIPFVDSSHTNKPNEDENKGMSFV